MQASEPESRPRVAVFCRSFLPLTQTFVYDAVTRLTRYRASVFCVLREYADNFPYQDVRVAWPGTRNTIVAPNFFPAFVRQQFDVVHAHFGTGGVYALPYMPLARCPLVVTFHGYDVPLLDHARRILGPARQYAWLGRSVLRAMTLGLCDSADLRDMLIARGVPAERLRVHLLGVDTQRFRPDGARQADGTVRVLMVGRFVEKKGFVYGIEAFGQASRVCKTALTIVGEGPLEPELKAKVRELGIESQVQFTGALPHDRVLALMQSHDILVAPSTVAQNGDRDSGLLVLREAASSGMVPIATRHGGLPDSVDDGTTGFLVEERDVAAMAERLKQLFTDPALRTSLSQGARQKMIRELDHSVSIAALERAYDDARSRYAQRRTSAASPRAS
jgi:colanic acid/amylovoran biosynthesis glycosyltransferase